MALSQELGRRCTSLLLGVMPLWKQGARQRRLSEGHPFIDQLNTIASLTTEQAADAGKLGITDPRV
eukprot:110111-Pelagomonas_calceolata.AAC.4